MKERRHSQSETDTIPDFIGDEEGTKPITLVERGEAKHHEELRILQDRYDRDPAFRALWNMMRRQRRESNRTLGKVADAASTVHHDVGELKDLVEKIQTIVAWQNRVDTSLSIVKWIAGFVLAATLGSVIVLATKIYTWGVNSGELEIRLRHIEQALERRRNATNDFSYPSPASTTTPTRNQ